jgi:hypothetical protein
MSETLGRIAIDKLLVSKLLVIIIKSMRRSKSLTISIIYICIYMLNLIVLSKIRRWILLINTDPLIILIKIIFQIFILL